MTEQITDYVQRAVAGAGENVTVQAAVGAAAAVAAIPPPSSSGDVAFLWKVLILGLFLVLIIALGGVFYEINVLKSCNIFAAIFSTVFGGLIGLFVKSPLQK